MSRLGQYAVPVGVVGIVLLLVVPIPAVLLDVLIITNIAMSLLALLTAMYVTRPLDFSVFPSLLLVLTLFRLGLNVASVRLVLADGYAGAVIAAFGHVVIGSSVIIGLVIFAILVVIQFAVVTNGATRVAEVGARFTLDAMPGKQMAIDADLNAGIIDENEARRRREEVTAEADFYGAMDGASKFVKGDAIAAVIITLINLIGGFAIGMLQQGMSWSDALHTYSLLTVGDGIVSQVPALLLSVATGLVVTRSTTHSDMGSDAAGQLFTNPRALYISAGAIGALGLVPGLPTPLFLGLGAALVYAAQRASARSRTAPPVVETQPEPRPGPDSIETLAEDMRVDPLEIVLSADLVDLVDVAGGGDLLDRVRSLRRKVALEIGIVLPPVRTRDSLDLSANTYAVRISGIEVGRGIAPPGQALALGESLEPLPGRSVVEPVFGLAGKWIPEDLRHQAELLGATVVDRSSVIITHLSEIVRAHAARLLSREDVKALAESLKKTHPVIVEEVLGSGSVGLPEVQAVLAGLLDERVPIRDLARIFESVSAQSKHGADTDALVDAARGALGPAVAASFTVDGVLQALTIDPLLEQAFVESARVGEGGRTVLALDPQTADRFLAALASRVNENEAEGRSPVLACAPALRPAVRRLVAAAVPHLPVLSYTEAGLAPRVETLGTVSCAPASVV